MNEDYIFEEEDEVKVPPEPTSSYTPVTPPGPKKGLAVTAMVLGVVSLVFFLFVFNIFTGISAIILSIVYLAVHKGKDGKIMAVVGLITAVLSLVLFFASVGLILGNIDHIRPASYDLIGISGMEVDSDYDLDVQDTL